MRISSHFSALISPEIKQGRLKEWTCVHERKPAKHPEPSAAQQLAGEWGNAKGR